MHIRVHTQIASGRLVHLHLDDDTDLAPSAKRRKVASSRIERPRGVAAQFRQTDISDIHEVSGPVSVHV